MKILYETQTIESEDVNICYVVRQYPMGLYYTWEVQTNKQDVRCMNCKYTIGKFASHCSKPVALIRLDGFITFDQAIDDARERYGREMYCRERYGAFVNSGS